MPNAAYLTLRPEVLLHLAADPSDPVIEHAIKMATIEFCAESWIWRHLHAAIDIAADQQDYALDIPEESVAALVLSASLDDKPLDPMAVDALDLASPRWRVLTGDPEYVTQVDPDGFMLSPIPTTTDGQLYLTVALQPSMDSDGAPDWLLNKYAEALADGALARLMVMSDKPWTDIDGGAYRRIRFDVAIAKARASAACGMGRSLLRTTPCH